jgi:hypothetical protein
LSLKSSQVRVEMLNAEGSVIATFRRKIDVFGIAVNGADKAEPAQDSGRDV